MEAVISRRITHGPTIKTLSPKCRLYCCLVEFVDWRYSQSCIRIRTFWQEKLYFFSKFFFKPLQVFQMLEQSCSSPIKLVYQDLRLGSGSGTTCKVGSGSGTSCKVGSGSGNIISGPTKLRQRRTNIRRHSGISLPRIFYYLEDLEAFLVVLGSAETVQQAGVGNPSGTGRHLKVTSTFS